MSDVLCVGYSCPPILDPQSILLAKMLRPLEEHGLRFHVVALDPDSCHGRTDPSLESLLPAGARIARVAASEKRLWFRGLTRALPKLLRVPDKHLPVHFRALRAAHSLARAVKPAALFSWAQYHSCSLVALGLKRRLGLPWVAHFSDPWHKNPYRSPGALEEWINARFEQAVVTGADAVVFVNEETRDATLERYPTAFREKTHVIPHCFEPGLYPRERTPHPGILFRHIGHFYGARGIRPLLEAIVRLRSSSPALVEGVTFEMIGRIRQEEVAEVRSRNLDGLVLLRPGVSYRESLKEMRDADVLLLVEAAAATNLFLPSKLVDYLGAGRPILALTPPVGPAARLLATTGDVVVPPDDVPGIASALERRITEHRAGAEVRRGVEAIRRFEARATTAALAEIFRNLESR